MAICSAFGCTKSDKKGDKHHRFPRGEKNRALWGPKVKREGWQPTDCSRLCKLRSRLSSYISGSSRQCFCNIAQNDRRETPIILSYVSTHKKKHSLRYGPQIVHHTFRPRNAPVRPFVGCYFGAYIRR